MAEPKWQLHEAKADLSALIRAAESDGPQTITRNGKDVAVVLSLSAYEGLQRKKAAGEGSLLQFFAAWPPLDIPRRDRGDLGRRIEL